jgi:hypothetical protein
MKRWIPLGVPLLMLGLISGCLEFERQTMSLRHDQATDTLYIFQDYQGIFGGDNQAHLSDDEIDQLASVMRGERTFFFNNWVTEYNRERLFEFLREPAEGDESSKTTFRALAQTALDNVKVENVGFYLNEKKHLSGAQRVTVKNVSKVLAALNKAFAAFARDEANKDGTSADSKQQLLKFADSGQETLRLDGNRLEIRWPLTNEEFREAEESAQVKAFRAAGGQIELKDGVVVASIGQKDAKTLSLTLPFSEKTYMRNAIEKARKHGIKTTFDAAQAAEAFFTGAAETK